MGKDNAENREEEERTIGYYILHNQEIAIYPSLGRETT